MTVTRAELRRQVSRLLREPFVQIFPTGFATGSGGTAGAPELAELAGIYDDDAFNHQMLYNATDNEERLIVDYITSSGTMTVLPAFTNAPTGKQFEVHSRSTAYAKNDAINAALRAGWPHFYNQISREIAIPENRSELTPTENLPADWYELLNAWYEPPVSLTGPFDATGYASAGGNTTLTVASAAWTAGQFAGHQLAVINGAGVGQVATVASNTATTVTVADPTTALATNTRFYLKARDAFGPWRRVHDVMPEGHPLMARLYLPTWLQAIPGASVRLEGLTRPAPLASDAATTELPEDYLRVAAVAELAVRFGLDDSALNDDVARFVARWDVTAARDLARQLAWPAPSGTKFRDPRGYSDVRDPADPLDWRAVL